MSNCNVKNTGDTPLCITDPDTGKVYCVLAGQTCKARTEWVSVRNAIQGGRASVVSGAKKK